MADILRAEELDIRSAQDQLQAIESNRAAEKDRAQREYQQHHRDIQASQAEADRLDYEHRARLFLFQREERELEPQLVSESEQLEARQSTSTLSPSPARPSAGTPLAVVASAYAPLPYQPALEASCDAQLFLREQCRASSRSPTHIDTVPPAHPQRVQSLWPVDRGPSTEVPQSDFSTTAAHAARHDRREGWSFEPYQQQKL